MAGEVGFEWRRWLLSAMAVGGFDEGRALWEADSRARALGMCFAMPSADSVRGERDLKGAPAGHRRVSGCACLGGCGAYRLRLCRQAVLGRCRLHCSLCGLLPASSRQVVVDSKAAPAVPFLAQTLAPAGLKRGDDRQVIARMTTRSRPTVGLAEHAAGWHEALLPAPTSTAWLQERN